MRNFGNFFFIWYEKVPFGQKSVILDRKFWGAKYHKLRDNMQVPEDSGMRGVGCGVRGAGCGVRGAGYGVRGTRFRVRGTRYGVQGTGCGVRVVMLWHDVCPWSVTW